MNRSARLSFHLLAALLPALLAFAPQAARADIETVRSANNVVWASVGSSLLRYKEPTSDPTVILSDSEHGWMPSGAFGVSLLGSGAASGIARNLYLSAEGSVTSGDVTYSGAYLATPTVPLTATTNQTVWNLSGKIGRAFELGNYVMATPYAEMGFRYWRRDLGSGQIEDYKHAEALGGLMLQAAPTSSLTLTAFGAAGSTFNASMALDDMDFNLGSRGIYKFGGKVGYMISPRFELFTTADYTYFRYGASDVNNLGYYEPASHTEQVNYRLGLAYHYR